MGDIKVSYLALGGGSSSAYIDEVSCEGVDKYTGDPVKLQSNGYVWKEVKRD